MIVCEQVVIGNREWMLRNGVELHMDTERKMAEEEECGHTAVLVAIDGMCYSISFSKCTTFLVKLLKGV